MICEVCDKPGKLTQYHGISIHERCAPSRWREDKEDRNVFMSQVTRLVPSRAARWRKWK